MAASIDDYDSVLKKTLESRRKLFFQNLPAGGSATSRENKWAAYILSLSQSTTPSRTNSLDPAAAYTAEGHAPPLPKAAPEAKRRRLVGVGGFFLQGSTKVATEYGRLATCSPHINVPAALVAKPHQWI